MAAGAERGRLLRCSSGAAGGGRRGGREPSSAHIPHHLLRITFACSPTTTFQMLHTPGVPDLRLCFRVRQQAGLYPGTCPCTYAGSRPPLPAALTHHTSDPPQTGCVLAASASTSKPPQTLCAMPSLAWTELPWEESAPAADSCKRRLLARLMGADTWTVVGWNGLLTLHREHAAQSLTAVTNTQSGNFNSSMEPPVPPASPDQAASHGSFLGVLALLALAASHWQPKTQHGGHPGIIIGDFLSADSCHRARLFFITC